MGFWIILAWRKTMSRPEFQKKIEKNWKVSLEDWRGWCKSGSSLCSILAVEPWRNHATINTAEDKRKRRLSNVKSSVNGRFLIPYDRNEGIFVKSLHQILWKTVQVWSFLNVTIWAFCHLHKLDHAIQAEQPGWGAAVCDSLRPWHVFALRRSTKSPLNSHTSQIWCWQNAANSETTATHCKHSAPGLPSWHTAPSRRSFVKALAAWFFVSYWTAFYSRTVMYGYTVIIYCYCRTLYDCMLYPSTTTCVQSFHRTWPLSVAGAAKLGELARHVPQVWLQMFQNTWHLGEFIPFRQPGLQSLRSTASDTIYWHMMIFILHFATCSVLPSGERTLGLTSHRRSTVCFCAWWQGLQRCHSTSLEDSLQKNKCKKMQIANSQFFFIFCFQLCIKGMTIMIIELVTSAQNHWTTVPSQLWGTPFTEEFTRATASERSITWRKLSGRIRWISRVGRISSFFFRHFPSIHRKFLKAKVDSSSTTVGQFAGAAKKTLYWTTIFWDDLLGTPTGASCGGAGAAGAKVSYVFLCTQKART